LYSKGIISTIPDATVQKIRLRRGDGAMNMFRNILTHKLWILGILCVFSISASGDLPGPEEAPLNPRFLQYLRSLETQTVSFQSDDGYGLGEIPATVDLSHVRNVLPPKQYVDSYTATYDLRPLNKLTSIRNQGACGSCWTFGTYASLESYGKPLNTWNFSEQDLNATHGYDFAECAGGNHFMSAAYLARWAGPLSETDVPYPYGDGYALEALAYNPQKHVQQVVFLPERSGFLDNDTIKYFVTTEGAVYVSFYYGSSYMDSTDENYYYYSNTSTNHAVAVVGWDDNYDKSNFKTTPPGNGAFLIRNSWGTRHGDGYFWLSYYDTSFKPRASFNNAEAADNYERIYQYDTLGWIYSYGSSTTAWGANIFTASDNQPLRGVSFYTTDANTNYTIYIYTGVSGGDPRSGSMQATKSGSKTYPGYYTVPLDTPVSLSSGQNFSVVIRFNTETYGYPLAIEAAQAGYSSGATTSAGESYYSSSGSSWSDISLQGYNACIKAFASASVEPNHPDFNQDGNADILWRKYATGGNNAVWLRGTGADPTSLAPFKGINPNDPVDLYSGNTTIIGKPENIPPGIMELSLLEMQKMGIKDGFSEFQNTELEPTHRMYDAIPPELKRTRGADAETAASSLVDPRNDSEAVELLAEPDTFWRLCGTGDFNSDDQIDLVWRNLSNGQNVVWLMNGITRTAVAYLPTAPNLDWMLCGTGDFNDDENIDLVWRNLADGRNAVWYMDGVSIKGYGLLPPATNLDWVLCGTGDFNYDGRIDLIWRNMSSGKNGIWYLDGVAIAGYGSLPQAANLDWVIAGTGDFNNDGKVDLIWRNISTGQNGIWFLNGMTMMGYGGLTTVTDTNWMIEN
jgi:C1A family cysteine protease